MRSDFFFSQPEPPPQYDVLPRRSPVAGTGLDEPGVSHAVMQQTEQEESFSFQADIDGFLQVNCISLEQEGTFLLQADVGIKPEITGSTAQVAARETFAGRPKNRQQRRVRAWGTEANQAVWSERVMEYPFLPRLTPALCVCFALPFF